MVTPSDHKMGYALWNCIRSDRTQRETFSTTIRHRLQYREKPLEEFNWFLKQMPGIEDRRNNIVHAPHGIDLDFDKRAFRMYPDAATGNQRAANLVSKDFHLECTNLVETIDALSKWIKKLEVIALLDPAATGDEPLPERPKIQKPAHPG
jgi:hypothetical protein